MSYEKMEEDLTCPVCLELYADPLMMPCSHSVCKACLHDIMKSREKSGKQDLECPACREIHHLSAEQVNLLPKNLALENIVFRYQEIRSCSLSRAAQLASPSPISQQQSSSSHSPAPSPCHDVSGREQDSVFDDSIVEERLSCGMCEEPEKNEAEWFCPQCQVLYCQVCLDIFHPRRGSLVKHKVRRPRSTENPSGLLLCHDHSNEVASIFCDTCKVVACHLCVCMGQGSHCAHTILDLETAKRQLQGTVETAQEKLSTLIASFSERETNISTHLKNVKVLEDCAKSCITSQYNCIMSDITDTLDMAQRKSLDAITELSSSHSSYLLNRCRHIKALLSRCEDLNEACSGFLASDEDNGSCGSGNRSANSSFGSFSKPSKEETIQSSKHRKLKNMMPTRYSSEVSALLEGHSTDGSSISIDNWGNGKRHSADCDALSREHSKHGSTFSDECTRDMGTELTVMETKSSSALATPSDDGSRLPRKLTGVDQKNKVSTEAHVTDSVYVGGEAKGRDNFSGKFLSNFRPSTNSLVQLKSRLQSLMVEKGNQSSGYKDSTSTDEKNQSVDNYPQPQQHSNPESLTQASAKSSLSSELDFSDSRGQIFASGTNRNAFSVSKKQLKRTQARGQLLLRADEVGPVLEQVSALSKQFYLEDSKSEDNMDASAKDHNQNINSCVSSFHMSTLHLINNMTDQITAECPVIIPCVRSVSVSSPHQESCVPRVQSRVLMTWGFNSTTFTADPVTSSAQWTIDINRNTSHIGDVKSGYLFGVGIAFKPMNSKEQVGMSSESHAIVCMNGNLAMCHNKQISSIMPLSGLPLTVTISVHQSQDYCLYMTYKIRFNGLTRCLQGKRVILFKAGDGGNHDRKKNETGKNLFVCNLGAEVETRCYDEFKIENSEKLNISGCGNLDDKGSKRSDLDSSDDGGFTHLPASSSFSVHPIFTVSQRVKMQFTHSSEV